jgi:dUTPase
MRDSEQLVVLYEVSTLAQQLSKELNIEWGLTQESPFDSVYFLRNSSLKEKLIPKKSVETIYTGLYVQLTDPRVRMQVVTNSNVLRSKNIGVLNSIFDYDFRNEITLIVYNYGDKDESISQGEIIANLTFSGFPLVRIKKVERVESGEKYKGTKDNNWVQEEKRERTKDIVAKNYSREHEKTNPISKHIVNKVIQERTR